MSKSRLMMAGVSTDGGVSLRDPNDGLPQHHLELGGVLTPGSNRGVLVEVVDRSRLIDGAASEISALIRSSGRLMSLCRATDPGSTPHVPGFGVVPTPPRIRFHEFGVSQVGLGGSEIPGNTWGIAFSQECAGWAAARRTQQQSGPVELYIDSWGPMGLPLGFPFSDPDEILRQLLTPADAVVLVIPQTFG